MTDVGMILEELAGSDLTPSARLVAVIQALGIEEPKEIERLAGLGERGARKARRQLTDCRKHRSGTTVRAQKQIRRSQFITDAGAEKPRFRVQCGRAPL